MDMTLPRELLVSPAGREHPLERAGEIRPSQFEVEFDPEYGVVWGMFNPKGTPCFSLGLLNDIRAHDEQLELNRGRVLFEGETRDAHYYVAGSKVKGVFNLGGDLALFTMLIKARDREALRRYAHRCIDCINGNRSAKGSSSRVCRPGEPALRSGLVSRSAASEHHGASYQRQRESRSA